MLWSGLPSGPVAVHVLLIDDSVPSSLPMEMWWNVECNVRSVPHGHLLFRLVVSKCSIHFHTLAVLSLLGRVLDRGSSALPCAWGCLAVPDEHRIIMVMSLRCRRDSRRAAWGAGFCWAINDPPVSLQACECCAGAIVPEPMFLMSLQC